MGGLNDRRKQGAKTTAYTKNRFENTDRNRAAAFYQADGSIGE